MSPSTTTSDSIFEFKSHLSQLESMRHYPEKLYGIGDRSLLQRRALSIVGTRKPSAYTRDMTARLASGLAARGICIVSGAAMGVDAIAHRSAGAANTIAVMANGLDIRYPAVNRDLIAAIEKEGLVISQFEAGEQARPWSFVVRNEVVVALGEALIVMQADPQSGTLRSVEFALKMGRPVYALVHRIGESEGSNGLLREGVAQPLYDIEDFCERFGTPEAKPDDAVLDFCRQHSSYDDAFARFGAELFAYELDGKIAIENGTVRVL